MNCQTLRDSRFKSSRVNSSFQTSEFNQVPKTSVALEIKSKLSPCFGSAALRQLNSTHTAFVMCRYKAIIMMNLVRKARNPLFRHSLVTIFGGSIWIMEAYQSICLILFLTKIILSACSAIFLHTH